MIGTIVDCCDCGRMEGCSRDDALERAADGGSFVWAEDYTTGLNRPSGCGYVKQITNDNDRDYS